MRARKFSCVYFIQAGKDGPVKVGTTKNLSSRFRALQCGNHETLRLLINIPGDKSVERILHIKLAKHHLRGEWYNPHKDVFAIIESTRKVPILDQVLTTVKKCCKCGEFLSKSAKDPCCKKCRRKETKSVHSSES